MKKLDRELGRFLDDMTDGMGRPERRRALSWYFTGLLLEGERKTLVSMAGRLVDDPGEIGCPRPGVPGGVPDRELFRVLARGVPDRELFRVLAR